MPWQHRDNVVLQASKSLGRIKKQNPRILIFLLLLWPQIKLPLVASGHKQHRRDPSAVSLAKHPRVIHTCSSSLSLGLEIL